MEKKWFRAKRYGWGWVPITWQGWSVTLLYVVLVTIFAVIFLGNTDKEVVALLQFLFCILITTAILMWVSYKTGDKPEWRWNGRPTRTSHKNPPSNAKGN